MRIMVSPGVRVVLSCPSRESNARYDHPGGYCLERRVAGESLLCGGLLISATGLCSGRPTVAATGPCAPLGGLLRALLGLRRVTLLRGAVAASLPLVTLREVLNPVTVDLHGRLALVNVRAADSARDNHGVSGADPKPGDQVMVVAPVGDVIERLGKGVESALVVLS